MSCLLLRNAEMGAVEILSFSVYAEFILHSVFVFVGGIPLLALTLFARLLPLRLDNSFDFVVEDFEQFVSLILDPLIDFSLLHFGVFTQKDLWCSRGCSKRFFPCKGSSWLFGHLHHSLLDRSELLGRFDNGGTTVDHLVGAFAIAVH